MKKIESEVAVLITIGNWARSCKTLEQLNNVKTFLTKRVKTTKEFSTKDTITLNYHLGIVDGIILSLKEVKFH